MARTFWKGAISFGMVVIPVKMYVATRTRSISFHILHKKCHTRLKQVWFCENDQEFVNSKDTERGYEYAKGQNIVITEEDFEKVPVKTTHTIDILGFAGLADIDLIYYQDSHYLEPEDIGRKPFTLLKEVLVKTGKAGIAKVTFQRKEHLCLLKPLEDLLVLHTLYYPAEIVDRSEFKAPETKTSEAELSMASTLVEAMTTGFKPEEYKDNYQEGLREMVEAKLKGIEIKPPEEEKIQVEDLMSALKASVEAARKRSAEKEKVTAG